MLIRNPVKSRPTGTELKINLQKAVGLHGNGRLTEAEHIYRKVLDVYPDNADANHLLGVLKHQQGDNRSAVDLITRAISSDESQSVFHNNLGIVLGKERRTEQALNAFDKALEIQPGYPEAQNNRGVVLRDMGRNSEAILAFETALSQNPQYAEAHNNLGSTLKDSGNLDGALVEFDLALEINPDYAEAINNRGTILKERLQVHDALAEFEHAIRIRPQYAEAHWNRGITLLLLGQYKEGWREFEWRHQNPGFASPRRNFGQPLWDGSPLDGKTLLVHTEQGAGDSIQFVRFLTSIEKDSGKILLECEPALYPLFSSMSVPDALIKKGEAIPHFDIHVPIMSLPFIIGTNSQTIPSDCPYLECSQPSSMIHGESGRKKVGLVWAGNPRLKNDRNRSMAFRFFVELLDLNQAKFFSLQSGERSSDIRLLNTEHHIKDLSPLLKDYAVTADIISQLDLIITVDTSVAHLAGALGRPVWTLLCYAPDWRWQLDSDQSIWYPTMRLFRQQHPGDWGPVIRDVKAELERFVEG